MIETPNLKLKKWQSTDMVADMLTWLNSNADALDTALGARPQLYTGTISAGESVTFPENVNNYSLLGIVTSNSDGASNLLGFSLYAPAAGPMYIPVMYGSTSTWIRIGNSGTTFSLMSSGTENIRIKTIYGLLKTT